jgi:hypothetical protein
MITVVPPPRCPHGNQRRGRKRVPLPLSVVFRRSEPSYPRPRSPCGGLECAAEGLGLRSVVDDSLSEASGDDDKASTSASPSPTAVGYNEAHKFMTSCVPAYCLRPMMTLTQPVFMIHHRINRNPYHVHDFRFRSLLFNLFCFCFLWVFLPCLPFPPLIFFSSTPDSFHAGTSRIHHHQATTARRS